MNDNQWVIETFTGAVRGLLLRRNENCECLRQLGREVLGNGEEYNQFDLELHYMINIFRKAIIAKEVVS